jgi:hypothetical protein
LPPLSNRFPFDATPNAIAAARAAAGPLRDLSLANPTQAGIALPTAELVSSMAYVPNGLGARATREAIASYYRAEFHAEIDPDRIVLCASTSEGYSFCLKLVANPGDEVLVPQPSYPLLQFLIAAEGATAVPYPLHHTSAGWFLDRDALAARVTPRTRAAVLVHPNNPTGHYTATEDVAWLRSLAAGRFWVISDEVFADYAWTAQRPRSLANENAFVLSGLSKVCGLPQMKLAWIVLPVPDLRGPLEWIADTYLSVSAPIERAAPGWIEQRAAFQAPIRGRCRTNLQFLSTALLGPWTMLPPEAGWCAILQGPRHAAEETMVLEWIRKGFFVQPGFYYDLPMEPALVVSLLSPPQDLADFLAAIAS